jgi:mycothiol synthase
MRLRAPVPDDAAAVLDVLVARDIADLGVPDYTREDLLDEWRASEFSLASDARVVELEGRIAAYGVARRRGSLGVVAPEFEGRGVGSQLLRWIESREREQGVDFHRQWFATGNERARSMLVAARYTWARSYLRMVRQLGELEAARRPPEGVHLRGLDPEADAASLHELDAASFATTPDYVPVSLSAFREEEIGAHDVDPGLSRVAEREGKPVGFLLARRWRSDAVGFVEILAVHPAEQSRGVGSAMLSDAFARFAEAGLREAQLGVASDNPRALRLYERMGMTPRWRFDTYERPIRSTDDGTGRPLAG